MQKMCDKVCDKVKKHCHSLSQKNPFGITKGNLFQ